MSKLEKLKDKAKALEAKDPKSAIDAWVEVLKLQDEEPNPDLSLFNRVGDLYLKLRDPAQAADCYERAVDRYADLGFHNNAIAMCNKVLRNAPGRQQTYIKLAKLYASKGFFTEAKQNFVEFAERMQKTGQIQQAFAALKELADLAPQAAGLREMLEAHMRTYGVADARPAARASQAGPAAPPKPAEDLSKSGKRKTTSLVFLDLDEPAKPKGAAPAPSAPERPRPPAPPPSTPEPAAPVASVAEDHLEIESTTLAGADADAPEAEGLEGLEARVEFGDVQRSISSLPLIGDDALPAGDTGDGVAGLEPTTEPEPELEPIELEAPDLEPPPAPPAAPPRPPAPAARPQAPQPRLTAPAALRAPVRPAATPPGRAPSPPAAPVRAGPAASPTVPQRPAPAPARVTAPMPKLRRPEPPQQPVRPTLVEVPPLELEPDFEAATTAGEHEVDDEPLADDVPTPVDQEEVLDIPKLDLGVDGLINQSDVGADLVDVDDESPASGLEALEASVADEPDDPERHRALGEALIEAGERERGVEELDLALDGYEARADMMSADGVLDELLHVDPNSVRHRQKRVEYAFKTGEKARLIDAYVELADTLLRGDLPDKARAVYLRVIEHDPQNPRAQAALTMLAPTAAPKAPPAREERVAPKDAKLTVRDTAGTAGDFIDLGALILDHGEHRDSRMKVEEEEPTGDEEKDFHEMLARFRQGIDENIDEGDFQSHYDLGVAFKEMGLLDEAIAEFQKALQAPEGKLRAVEALGTCFLDKGAIVVAESILRRGLELPAASDQERLGVLYSLARALEGQERKPEARTLYQRVFAVDIGFKDVSERMKALGKAK